MFTSLFQGIFCSGSRKEPTCIPSPQGPSKYLVLDLDETLIHCKPEIFDSHDLVLKFERANKQYYLSRRPYLIEFIEQMSKYYNIVIYTASSKSYAYDVLKSLQIRQHVKRVLHRGHLVDSWEGFLTKDLSKLKVALKDVILVDDCASNSFLYPGNFLQIRAYDGNHEDRELLDLIPFLKELATKEDVRNVSYHYAEFQKKRNQVQPEEKSQLNLIEQIVSRNKEKVPSELVAKLSPVSTRSFRGKI